MKMASTFSLESLTLNFGKRLFIFESFQATTIFLCYHYLNNKIFVLALTESEKSFSRFCRRAGLIKKNYTTIANNKPLRTSHFL